MNSITDNVGAIVLVVAGLCLVVMLVLQAVQINRLRERLDSLTRGSDGQSLEAVFDAHLETVHQVGRDLDELTARTAVLESSARHHFARMGLIRFNPFPDTGGNQSFALALLDESEEGFVVSSLHSRTGTRIYAKAIVGGKADTSLSTEETEAMGLARSRKTVRPAQAASRAASGKTASPPAEATTAGASTGASLAKAAAASPKATPAPAPAPAKAPVAARVVAPAKVAAPAGGVAPAPVKVTAPADASAPAATVVAASARVPAPARAASAGGASDRKVAGGSETTDRTLAAKGQRKGQEDAVEDSNSAAESERIGRKPGRSAPAEPTPGERTDTPGS